MRIENGNGSNKVTVSDMIPESGSESISSLIFTSRFDIALSIISRGVSIVIRFTLVSAFMNADLIAPTCLVSISTENPKASNSARKPS